MQMTACRGLSPEYREICVLEKNRCNARDWSGRETLKRKCTEGKGKGDFRAAFK